MSTNKLTMDFLAPYYKKGDNFPNLLARSTYLSKYSRDGESWTDTIRRVVDGNCDLDPACTMQERERLFHIFWTMQALPPGRGLWVGGVDGIPADARYNCFKGTTRFFADGKLAALQDLVGQTVQVRCVDGKWRPAEVKNFGKQKLFKFVLRAPGRSNFELVYEATENHRWLTDNRGMIDDLRVGDTIRVTPDPVNEDTQEFKDGFAHGVVFGDGTSIGEGLFKVRLCGKKAELVERLKMSKTFRSSSNPPSYNGDAVVLLTSATVNMKATPLEGSSFDYQAGFLAGWLATDGSTRSDGRGGTRLSSINHEALNWVIERAPFLGYCVTGDTIDSTTETNYGKRNGQVRVLTLTTESVLYTVRQKIDEGVEEDVFCVTEPETHTFTIEGGVRTGQCWYTTIQDYSDWGWVANQLMLGGGVGVGLHDIAALPLISRNEQAFFEVRCAADHPNVSEVKPDHPGREHCPNFMLVPDSREGWVSAILMTLKSAYNSTSLVLDVSQVRPRGAPIKTFGGIACGPGPLVELLRSLWNVVRGAQGRRLTSVEALDITNYIGKCIKAGNVRRSALIALGRPDDQDFRNAKKDLDAVFSHRHTSNNSIAFESFDQFENFDWRALALDNCGDAEGIGMGEPGLLNLALARLTDPRVRGVNPCGEQCLEDREACNLAEVFPANFDDTTNVDEVFKLVARYCLRVRLTPLLDARSNEVGRRNMRIGVGLGGICDFEWSEAQLAAWYRVVRDEADRYARELGVARPITTTTVKPSGTISLLCGSSPGIHAPFAEYYIRRTRHADNDPMTQALIEAGVPYEPDQYDSSGHTLVFSFPMKAKHTRFTTQTETVEDQFKRQLAVQNSWADNAVSATITFDKQNPDELAACLEKYAPRLKSTSCLPRAHGYVQAPYEAIDRAQFERLAAGINFSHPLKKGGEFEIEECATGVCPIR